jgi:LacI family transcriptional regulator
LHERDRGYISALKENGLIVNATLHKKIRKSHYVDDVAHAMRELLSDASSCDAIFFATDTLAIAGLKNIIELNVKVPNDISVISFDESETFNLFECPVTHFKQPLEEMGIAAVDLLFEVMKEDKGKQIYLESKLVMGKSCGE